MTVSWRRAVYVTGATVVVSAGVAGGFLFGSRTEHEAPSELRARLAADSDAPAPATPDVVRAAPVPDPQDRSKVLDVTGRVRGTVANSDLYCFPESVPADPADCAPPADAAGWEVLGDDGRVSGYFMPGHGFVDAVSAADPEIVAALRANPRLVVDETGALLTPQEWAQRLAAGTAATR